MAGNQEEFDAIIAGQFESVEKGIGFQERLEKASQDPAIVESAKLYLIQNDRDQSRTDLEQIGQEICQKYDLDPYFFTLAWNMCVMRLEAEGFAELDVDQKLSKLLGRSATLDEVVSDQATLAMLSDAASPLDRKPGQEISVHHLSVARKLIEEIVWPLVYSDSHVSPFEIYRAAIDVCNGLPITYDEVRYIVDSLIPDAEAERDGREHGGFYDQA